MQSKFFNETRIVTENQTIKVLELKKLPPLTHIIKEELKNIDVVIPKKEMFLRTQICYNWKFRKECVYGDNCKFAHGNEQLQSRIRIQNYKSKPCADIMSGNGCPFNKKCSYAHPGDSMRAPQERPYYDYEYKAMVDKEFDGEKYPFGIFL